MADGVSPSTDGASSPEAPATIVPNPWSELRRYTPARIAQGRCGASLPTAPHLAFQLAHAQARDAVRHPLDVPALAADLASLGLQSVALQTRAADRDAYLQRPDLGRELSRASRERLERQNASPADHRFDLVFVVADGLSALAVQRHAPPLLAAILVRLEASPSRWHPAPVALVEQGRVAIGDPVGAALGAALSVVMIGERPGLSSPDSLGLYITWHPRAGRVDAERNCISNVRPQGLAYAEAARRLCCLLEEARRRGLTGTSLKDESESDAVTVASGANFLIESRHSEPNEMQPTSGPPDPSPIAEPDRIVVRPVAESDRDVWLPLWRGYQAFYAVDIPPAVTDRTWQRFLDPREPMFAALAWADGQAVGMVHWILHRSCWTEGDYCYLQDLFADAAMRGRGVGRRLIEHVYEEAARTGCSRVYWLTHESNSQAMQLYDRIAERSGFVQYRRAL